MNLCECLRVEHVVAGHVGMGLLMIRVIYDLLVWYVSRTRITTRNEIDKVVEKI